MKASTLLAKAMAPKAAMKAAVKAGPPSKSMKAKSVKKDAGLVKHKSLNKKNLAALPKESLEDKMQRAVETTSTPEDAAAELKKSLSKVEHSKIWGQHKTFLKNNPDEASADPADGTKKDKGLAAALWFINQKGKRFMNLTHSVGGQVTVKKLDQWQSEKQMLDRFGSAEFEAHCQSGRIMWRECPMTRGTFEYKDQHDISRETTTFKGKTLVKGQEDVVDDEDIDQMFEELYNQDLYLTNRLFLFVRINAYVSQNHRNYLNLISCWIIFVLLSFSKDLVC